MASDPLIARLLAALALEGGQALDGSALDESALAGALHRALEEARSAWPAVTLEDASFVDHLARHLRMPHEGTDSGIAGLLGAIAATRVSDLFLACACAKGDPRALASFEAAYGADLKRALLRVRVESAQRDDAEQVVREKLFVARADGTPPKISEYSGRGELRAWLKVAVVRVALNLATRGPRDKPGDLPGDDDLFDLLPAPTDPELERLKQAYRARIREIFPRALEAIEPRARTYLRHRYVDGLSIDRIGALYDVHRATVARHIAGARDTLLAQVRKRLREDLGLGEGETESVLRMVQSGFDIDDGSL